MLLRHMSVWQKATWSARSCCRSARGRTKGEPRSGDEKYFLPFQDPLFADADAHFSPDHKDKTVDDFTFNSLELGNAYYDAIVIERQDKGLLVVENQHCSLPSRDKLFTSGAKFLSSWRSI